LLLLVIPAGIASAQELFDPAKFCRGEQIIPLAADTSLAKTVLEASRCPQHGRINEPDWLDGAMYQLKFNYRGSEHTMLFSETNILQEQLQAALDHGITKVMLSVLPQRNCS